MKLIIAAAILLGAVRSFSQQNNVVEIIKEADILSNAYQFGKALDVLNQSEDSVTIGLLQRKAYCYSRLGNYEEAINYYERIMRNDSVNRDALHQLGQLYSRSEQFDTARSFYLRLIRLDSTNSFYYKQFASIAVKQEDFAKAILYYLQALQFNPRDIEAYAQLGSVMMDAEQYEAADSMLTEALALSENPSLRLLLARAKLAEGEYDAVIENVNQLLTKSDTTSSYARLLGISYLQLDQYEKVITCMDFLLKSGIKSDWIFYYLGVSYRETKHPEEGIQFLNLAIEESISDNISTYYATLALAYEEIRDFKNAIRYYKAAYESSKSDILLYHLARNYDVYYKDKTQALIYYKKYLDSDDTIKLAKNYSRQRLSVLSEFR